MSITLYQFEISPFADKVRRAMRWKGLEFAVIEVGLTEQRRYRRISPSGKFPAIVHEGRTIVDSTDILRFLDQRFPEKPLQPDNPRDRALAAILEDWADESLYFFDVTMRGWPQNRAAFLADLLANQPPGPVRNLLALAIPPAINRIARAQGLGRKPQASVVADLAALYDALEVWLEGTDWLAGPRLSNADLAVRAMVNVIDRTTEGARLRGERSRLDAWCLRVDREAPPEGLSAQRPA